MHTRVAEPADARAAAAVDVESWRAAYVDLMPADYLNDLSVDDRADRLVTSLSRQVERGKRTIVVEDDNGIFGYATVGPDEQEGVGLLYLMYVAPARWGQGGGSDLMAAATAALRELGYRHASLWVLDVNERARRFYESRGWRPDGQIRSNEYGTASLLATRYVIDL